MEYSSAQSFAPPRRIRTDPRAFNQSHQYQQYVPVSRPPPTIVPIDPEAYYPSPRHDSGRRRTESRYINEPGRSKIKISHRRASEYRKRSIYSAQHFDQALDPGLFHTKHNFNPYPETRSRRPEPVISHGGGRSRVRCCRVVSEDSEDEDRPSSPLSVGFSFKSFDPHEKSQGSSAQISLTSPGRGRISGSKSIVGDESKTYRESIINVSSSRYINSSDPGQSCGAELILQPPARGERSLQPLLNWM